MLKVVGQQTKFLENDILGKIAIVIIYLYSVLSSVYF